MCQRGGTQIPIGGLCDFTPTESHFLYNQVLAKLQSLSDSTSSSQLADYLSSALNFVILSMGIDVEAFVAKLVNSHSFSSIFYGLMHDGFANVYDEAVIDND